SASGSAPVMPRQLKAIAEPLTTRAVKDSKVGDISTRVVSLLHSGLPVAMVGTPLRVRLELNRLTEAATGIVVLRRIVPIQDLSHLARAAWDSGLILATACALLRPRMSVYEQGREVEATLRELAARALPVLTFGTREELEAIFSVGQGRSYSPLSPVIESLPAAEDEDLVQAALVERCDGLPTEHVDRLAELVLRAISRRVQEKDRLLQPLANLAAQKGAGDPDLPAALIALAENLAGRRDTFGTCDTAPAVPRTSEVCGDLTRRLLSAELEDLLRSRLFGQDEAINELIKRIRQEAICRPQVEPLRLMLAGPVGTGKSVAAKYIAEVLEWPYHYIDATAFDSEHAVMTSLAGASPGIVNSYNDGVLARISRRTSVVEVADLDHARPGVRGTLCEFFLRILQEGTLQTGSGMIVRSLPSVIFIFTSNIAYGTRKATAQFGFGRLTRGDIRQRVVSRVLEHLGHAFVSRVGEPILFDEFTHDTAVELARMEIRSLVGRVTGATTVRISQGVVKRILDSLPTMENGARGVIDATRSAMAEALLDRADIGVAEVDVRLEEDDIIVEPARQCPTVEPSLEVTRENRNEQATARPS
ncbi:MAG: AAA family ATPase, partial [Phycisphaerae bacterium]